MGENENGIVYLRYAELHNITHDGLQQGRGKAT